MNLIIIHFIYGLFLPLISPVLDYNSLGGIISKLNNTTKKEERTALSKRQKKERIV